ncbi:MAG: ABC transporter ATP-binding protein [Selenomonadaceae bacterium]|nr:ABC transporter ATP-binding protein [Selenomonadaceae bacterium]
MIRAESLTKKFYGDKKTADKTAVDAVSFRVKTGEVFGLLGPNGAGKTTVIRMLTLQTRATSGQIYYDGENIAVNPRLVKSLLGVVPQQVNFDMDLTVGENMELHGRLHHLSADTRKKRIDELLDFVELKDTVGQNVRRLSGGMKRRLLIARALIHRPRILFLDEPTVALDPQVRRRIWELIRRLAGGGTTIFLTTHYIEEAESLCQRVAVLNRGRLVALDTPKNLCQNLGAWTVEWNGVAGREYRFFPAKAQAADFAKELASEGSIELRPTNLEDAFIELTGRREGL